MSSQPSYDPYHPSGPPPPPYQQPQPGYPPGYPSAQRKPSGPPPPYQQPQPGYPPGYPSARQSDSKKLVAGIQITIGLVVVILVIATPFAWFDQYGYYDVLGNPTPDNTFAMVNANTTLVATAIGITSLAIAIFGLVWGWLSWGKTAKNAAKVTLYLGAFQWVWVIFAVLAVQNEITYYATSAVNGYSWWLGAASYATLLGAIIFTITGLMAVRAAKAVPPPS